VTTFASLSSLDADDFTSIALTPDGRVSSRMATALPDKRDHWVVIAPAAVRFHPRFQEIVRQEGHRRPDVDLFYGDEIEPTAGGGAGWDLVLKPDLDLALLIADDYVGVPLVVRASAMRRLGELRPAAGTAAAYELVLRALSAGLGITRITEQLAAHRRARPRPRIDDRRAALQAWLADTASPFDITDGLVPGTLRLQRRFAAFPDVTLVIPTRQSTRPDDRGAGCGQPYILDLLDSVARTDWPMDQLRVVIGDDVASDHVYGGQRWPFDMRRLVTSRGDGKFNYAEKINRLWRAAETEQIVIMNDDMVVRSADWLQALLTFSMQDDVGVAGARLIYPNDTIQHAGIPGGLFGMCAHAWLGQPAAAPTYQNWALVHREWSMMTGAVHATRKSVLELLNGFDERFSLEFNDVDFCLRARMLGYRNVYTPFAELVHHEKASRGEVLPPGGELALFLKRWGEFLEHDPAYHPMLARDRFQIGPVDHPGGWWQ
jgi:hypothetical protein